MVLPERIELSTSSLPMKCSTTELRQHMKAISLQKETRGETPNLFWKILNK